MNLTVITIIKKELARFFGDKRMAFTTVILPGLMIYVIYSFMGDALSSQYTSDKSFVPTVDIVNMPNSMKELNKQAKMKLSSVKEKELGKEKEKVTNQEVDLCLVFPKDFDNTVEKYSIASGKTAPNIQIYFNSAATDSQTAYGTVVELLDGYEGTLTNKFNVNSNKEQYDLATDKDTASSIFSSMLPMLLLIFLFSGCMAIAPESIAGEKERGTIATLLITPAKRGDIALGKIGALSLIALLAGVSSAIGTVLSLPKMMGDSSEVVKANVYKITDYLLLGLVILATVLVLITLISIISAFAKTGKEAQTYVMPLMILVMLIGVTAMFGDGAKGEWYYYLIPIYNSVQSMVSIFSFEAVSTHILITVGSNLICTGLGVVALTKMFNSEKIVFSR